MLVDWNDAGDRFAWQRALEREMFIQRTFLTFFFLSLKYAAALVWLLIARSCQLKSSAAFEGNC